MAEVGRTPADRSYLSIREVLDLLVEEFPDVTISKIRFLESRGLIHPERTPSGYRKFFEPDVERLRWILRQQREHFLPLKVIKGRLDREHGSAKGETSEPSLFDSDDATAEGGMVGEWLTGVPIGESRVGELSPARPRDDSRASARLAHPAIAEERPAPRPEAVAIPAAAPSALGRRRSDRARDLPGLTAAELVATANVTPALISLLEDYGLIASSVVGGTARYDDEAASIVRLAAQFEHFGIEPRHLSALKRAAERQASLFGQVVAPLLRQRNPEARERAQNDLDEMAQLGQAIQSSFLHVLLRDMTGL